jgi:hypothetical protein
MTAKNDVTGDLIKSRSQNKKYSDNYDRIFGNKNKNKDKEDKEDKK